MRLSMFNCQLHKTVCVVIVDCNDVRRTHRGEVGKGKKERRVL